MGEAFLTGQTPSIITKNIISSGNSCSNTNYIVVTLPGTDQPMLFTVALFDMGTRYLCNMFYWSNGMGIGEVVYVYGPPVITNITYNSNNRQMTINFSSNTTTSYRVAWTALFETVKV